MKVNIQSLIRCVDVSGRCYVCKYLHPDHYPQGGSEPGLNGLDNLYIYLQVALPSVSPSLRIVARVTCFDTE